MKLIVGLGNPGSQYERTRHNVGYMAVDRAVKKYGPANWRVAFEGFAADLFLGAEKITLLKPMTYMNLSGRSVASAMAFYKLTLDDLLVVVDDLALPVGTIRLRASGSAGGHNGLADIQSAMSSLAAAAGKTPLDYARLRIGIDPPGIVPQKSYVLTAFTAEQQPKMSAALDRAVEAVGVWVAQGITPAMNKFNGGEPEGERE